MISATAIIAIAERVRRHGGAPEVCVLHPTDHVYRLQRATVIDGVTLEPRTYVDAGTLWVTSRRELEFADNGRAWAGWKLGDKPFKQLLAESSIGAGLRDIKERGIDAHLKDLEREMDRKGRR